MAIQVKVYKGKETRRISFESSTTFAQLQEMIAELFAVPADSFTMCYIDVDGDIIALSSDAELTTAKQHLGETETWKLQVKMKPQDEQAVAPGSSWWEWNPFHWHPFGGHRHQHHGGLFGDWDEPFDFDPFGMLRHHHRRLQGEQRRQAEMARRQALRQASVDAKRASDEMQMSKTAGSGEVATKPKVVYHHFGSWEPKVEKGDNYVITTYGPVGYKVHYSYDPSGETAEEPAKKEAEEKEEGEKEPTKME